MQALTIRPAGRQLVYLLLGSVVLAATAAGAMISHLDGQDPSDRLLGLGIGVGAGAMIVAWAAVRYSLAVTVCSPAGLTSRGLGGSQQCSWHEVSQIAIRQRLSAGVNRPAVRTWTVQVTLTDGRHIALGAPVAGGIMPDPDFETKVAAIRQYWLRAVGGQARNGGRTPIVTAPRPRLPRNIRSAGRLTLGLLTIVTLATSAAIPVAVAEGGTAARVRLGQGVPGSYTAYGISCSSACHWVGVFMPAADGGAVLNGVTIAPGAGITRLDARAPAVDAGHPGLVYPAGGGTGWIPLAIVLAIALGGWLFAVSSALVTRIRRRRRSPTVPAPAPGTPWRAGRSGIGRPLPQAMTIVLVGAMVTAGYLVASHPLSSWTPTARTRACALYNQWLFAQPSSGTSVAELTVLNRAALEAPSGPLLTDLTTLDEAMRTAAADGGAATQAAAYTDMASIGRDCSRNGPQSGG